MQDKSVYWGPDGIISGQRVVSAIMDDIGVGHKDKFAPVVPQHFYRQFLLNGYIPDSILLLAHDVTQNAKAYEELFEDVRWKNTTIFMDNSLVELKAAVDINMVHEAVEIVGPHKRRVVVICPDVMAEGENSARLTIDSWPEWAWKFKDYEQLVVLQGNSMQSWLGCCEAIDNACLEPVWISIPRVTEGLWGYHRRELISFARAIFPNPKLHLLGFSDYIWEDIRAAAHPDVQSIDSAVPFRMSTLNVLSEKVPPRGEWWETANFDRSMLERVEVINDLINNFPTAK